MNGITRLASAAAFVGLVSQGCGRMEDSDVETTQSALGSFGATWTDMMGTANDGPALAIGPSLTAYALVGSSSPRQIFVTNQNGAGNWTGSWAALSSAGEDFASRPSATGFAGVLTGSLSTKLAIVAMRPSGEYALTIRDQTGVVVEQNWIGVPNGTFSSAPAIAFIPPNSANGPVATLVLAGRATTNDSRIWIATNTLHNYGSGFVYENTKWSGFSPVFSKTFAGPPALAYAYPTGAGSLTLVLAARDSAGQFWVSKFFGSSWTDWAPVANGLFFDGPALSVGNSNAIREITIYGRGTDNKMYWSTQLSGGAVGFTAISNDLFLGSPQAIGQPGAGTLGSRSLATVTAIKSGNHPYSNKANSP
jgi:hypothetical protein